jgi:hypothetical protein
MVLPCPAMLCFDKIQRKKKRMRKRKTTTKMTTMTMKKKMMDTPPALVYEVKDHATESLMVDFRLQPSRCSEPRVPGLSRWCPDCWNRFLCYRPAAGSVHAYP